MNDCIFIKILIFVLMDIYTISKTHRLSEGAFLEQSFNAPLLSIVATKLYIEDMLLYSSLLV